MSNEHSLKVFHEEQDDYLSHSLSRRLTQLRNAVLSCFVFVLGMFSVFYFFANELYLFVSEPLRAHLPGSASMIATDVASPFLTPFLLAFVLAIFVSIPFIFFHVWRLLKTKVQPRYSRLLIGLLISSIGLFYLGVAFSYFAVFPLVFGFFTQIAPEGVTVMTDISSYLTFVLKLFFAFGIAFEIPIVATLLILTGITSRESMKEKRPYVFVGCFVVGMLLTPPDILSQFLLAIPMWLLFEVGLIAARLVCNENESDNDDARSDGTIRS